MSAEPRLVVVRPSIKPWAMRLVQGAKGAPGSGSGSSSGVYAPFSWGDASPSLVYVVLQNSLLVSATILLRTAFNGAGAVLSLGLSGDPQAFVPPSAVDPGTAAEYETYPDTLLAAGTQILLFITPGVGANQGAGGIRLDLVPQ
jgi:hypothetical protein